MRNVVLIFPGQGSQSVGMGKDIYDKYSYVREMFKTASNAIGVDMEEIIFRGSEDTLKDTYNAQPSIFLISACMLEVLRREVKDLNVVAVAGHSLGEYSALYSSGVFSFEDGVRIVRKRGELMSKADPEGKGGMAAVIGLAPEKIKEVCDKLTEQGKYVEPVNYNAPDQTVISGYKSAIQEATELLKSAGAKRVIELAVSGAFHSKLMETPAKEFRKFLETINISEPSKPVIANYDAKPYPSSKEQMLDIMEKQMYSPVLWTSIVDYIKSLNPDLVIEVGPGQVLKGLVKKTAPEVSVITFSEMTF